MTRPVVVGSTNQSTVVRILTSGGLPDTGVDSATPGLAFQYRREGANPVSIGTITDLLTPGDAWSSGGFIHIGDGYYRLDVPNAAFVVGANGVMVSGSASNRVVVGSYHPLTLGDTGDAAETIEHFYKGPKRVVKVGNQWKFRVYRKTDLTMILPPYYEANIDDPSLVSQEDPQ